MKIISPIAIDMGAKNTGVYLNHFEQGEDPTTSGNTQGKTIVIDSNAITWSQAGRTQKRHQIRGNKRRKLAKRLLRLILTDAYKLTATQEQLEYLMGLLNNRGYNRIETTEEQEEILQKTVVSDFFYPLIFGKNANDNLLEALINKVVIKNRDNMEHWKKVLENKIFSLSGKSNSEFKEYLKNEGAETEKDAANDISKGFTAIKNCIKKQIENYGSGHLHRKDYLDNIRQDIQNSTLLIPLLRELDAEKLSCLIGNISNLQLRTLRKYFNNEAMKKGDQWLPERLHKFFFRWVRSWHAKLEDEKENRRALLNLKNQDILDVFTITKPILTIPPYEDQNNRIKENIKDKTLRLNPNVLDKMLTNWQEITNGIVSNYCLPTNDSRITTGCNDIVKNIIESTHLNIHKIKDEQEKSNDFERRKLANTLQRIFDRSRKLDPYRLRLLCAVDSLSNVKDDALISTELLNTHIGKNNIENFISLCKVYYEETQIAKQGLWSPNENSLFFACNTNPPHKGNLQHKLVGHIVRKPLTEKQLEQFKQECWNEKINRKTVKSIAESIEETRKEYGNAFNYICQTIKKRQYVLQNNQITSEQKNRWNKYESDHEDVVDAIHNTELVATKIDDFLQHNKKEKYNNPYSIAQLYNHLETNIGGFNKTDRWNTEENAWRDETQLIDIVNRKNGETIKHQTANATRLVKDSVRPFDGMLARILGRQAYEIAQFKIKQIEQLNINKNDKLIIPVFMEQNKFKFEESLHDIKGIKNVKKKTRDRVALGLKKQIKQWEEKSQRITKASTYCPYTDNIMTSVGEIDHIISRSKSKDRGDVVFNSEANLIYCSGTGNHAKGDRRYTFNNLQPQYLKSIFGTNDKNSIQQKIHDFVSDFDDANFTGFHTLETQEQQYLRHALFIPELDNKTFPLLNTRYKTIVNGTQSYLAKLLVKTLQDNYPEAIFKIYKIDAYEVSQLRNTLGGEYSEFAKSKKQGAFSHVVDAALVFATALQVEQTAETLQTVNTSALSENAEWLKELLPEEGGIKQIERKPKYRKDLSSTQIFKEGLYGERFLSILLDSDKLYYGFALDNCHEIKPSKKQVFATLEEYFDLLKPFLCTGSTRKKNKKPVTGNLTETQQKYSYLSIDKTKALAHLQKCAKEVCNDEAIKQAVKLEELRYCVEKKKIESILLTGQNKKKFITQLDDKKFTVSKLKLPAKSEWQRLLAYPIVDYQKNETTLKECFGKDEQIETDNQEMVNFWQDLATQSSLDESTLKKELLKINTETGDLFKPDTIIPQKVFSIKIKTDKDLAILKENKLLNKSFGMSFTKTEDLIPQESWEKLFQEFFHINKVENNSSHKQVRKEYSLPVVSAPSGGFRIKRKNSITGEDVYQVSSIEGFATKGYDKTITQAVLIDKLHDSRNIAPLDGKQSIPDEVCYFDQWRAIKLPDELKQKITGLSYAIGSKDRFRIKVTMSFNEFKKLDDTVMHFSQVPPEVTEPKKNDAWTFKKVNFQQHFSSKLLGKPRSNLFIEFINEKKIIFSYIVETTSKKMKTAYQNGTPIK